MRHEQIFSFVFVVIRVPHFILALVGWGCNDRQQRKRFKLLEVEVLIANLCPLNFGQDFHTQ